MQFLRVGVAIFSANNEKEAEHETDVCPCRRAGVPCWRDQRQRLGSTGDPGAGAISEFAWPEPSYARLPGRKLGSLSAGSESLLSVLKKAAPAASFAYGMTEDDRHFLRLGFEHHLCRVLRHDRARDRRDEGARRERVGRPAAAQAAAEAEPMKKPKTLPSLAYRLDPQEGGAHRHGRGRHRRGGDQGSDPRVRHHRPGAAAAAHRAADGVNFSAYLTVQHEVRLHQPPEIERLDHEHERG